MNVLIALDGSAISESALELAEKLLDGKPAQITLLHVIPRRLMYGKVGPVVAECYDPAEEQTASRTLLDVAAQRLTKSGASVSKALEVGDPADVILASAANGETDLIIMGSRGLTAAKRFLLGSVSTKVLTHAPCAVLVAHAKAHAVNGEVEMRQMVVATV